MSSSDELKKIANKLGIGSIQKHIFVCVGDKCCTQKEGMETWSWLKQRMREDDVKQSGIYRTKVGCLRVCRDGPIAVVYPEGTWYHNVSPEVCKRIVDEHLLGGDVVKDHCFAVNPLPEDSDA